MKMYKEVIVSESKQKRLDAVKCDLCGNTSPNGDNWKQGTHKTLETTVKIEERTDDYDGGGHSVCSEIDICPVCFRNKLIPWLKSQGAMVTEEERDW